MKVKISNFKKNGQKIKVKVHDYDVWNADLTLAHIIAPTLLKLKKTKHGAPFVENEDVPPILRASDEELKQYNYDGKTDKNFFYRWDHVLDKMIYSFEMISQDGDMMGGDEKRIQKGLDLFAKYYRALWS